MKLFGRERCSTIGMEERDNDTVERTEMASLVTGKENALREKVFELFTERFRNVAAVYEVVDRRMALLVMADGMRHGNHVHWDMKFTRKIRRRHLVS